MPTGEWVAWHLREAGHAVELDAWDWTAGDNAVLRMGVALDRVDGVVALISRSYFEGQRFAADEWSAVMPKHLRPIPLRIEDVDLPVLLGRFVARDLFGLDATQAGSELLEAMGNRRSDARAPGGSGYRRPCLACGTCPPATPPSPDAVFDNAQAPGELRRWLPTAPGTF